MFIGLLNVEQQEALCRILRWVARVDGIEDHREEALNAALLEESALDTVPEAAADLDEVTSLLGRFDTERSRRALLLEAFGVVLADAVAHPDELEAIRAIADRLGVSSEWLAEARDFVQRALDLQLEGRDLLG